MIEWLRTLVQDELWARVIVAAMIVAAFFFLSRVAKMLLIFLGHKVFARTKTVLDDKILEN